MRSFFCETMNGKSFLRIASAALGPTCESLGFVAMPPHTSGRYYLASWTGDVCQVAVTYEPGDDYLEIAILQRIGNGFADWDDRAHAPRLEDLRSRFLARIPQARIAATRASFQAIKASDAAEARMIRLACDLALVLPLFVEELGAQ